METYKSGQGSMARLAAVVLLVIALALGCRELYSWIISPQTDTPLLPGELFERLPVFDTPFTWQFVLCVALFVGGLVLVRRLLSRKATVDALIETEMEMKKVSWPSRDESVNATIVVILVTVILTGLLTTFDFVLGSFMDFLF